MNLSISRWRPRHLLTAWTVYWIALVGVTLGSAIGAILKVLPENAKGSVSAGFGNDGLRLTVTNAGRSVWDGSVSLTAAALWVAGPPLLIWIAWLIARPARPPVVAELNADTQHTRALRESPLASFDLSRTRERESRDR
ncbi:MAG: hypothetical protein ABI625_22035 [bacterium]